MQFTLRELQKKQKNSNEKTIIKETKGTGLQVPWYLENTKSEFQKSEKVVNAGTERKSKLFL